MQGQPPEGVSACAMCTEAASLRELRQQMQVPHRPPKGLMLAL